MKRLRILIAPDSFTGLWSAIEAGNLMRQGVMDEASARGAAAEVVVVPMADGGTGTVAVLAAAGRGNLVRAGVKDPLGEPRDAAYLRLADGTAVIEMAQASGIECLLRPTDRRHPFLASTFGTGELLLHAYGLGHRRIVVALGGSGTNDGGVGLCQALGLVLRNAAGLPYLERWAQGYGAAALLEASGADFSRMLPLRDVDLTVAADVDCPLLGPRGATAAFGPQKGATAEMIPLLEQALSRWAGWVESRAPSAGGGAGDGPLQELPGSGAAGGLGFALAGLFGGRLVRGSSWVADAVGVDAAMDGVALVLTGEGRLDGHSFTGKVVSEVADRARRASVPVAGLAGSVLWNEIPPGALDHIVDASGGAPCDLATLEGVGADRLRRAARAALAWHLDGSGA